MILGPGGDHVRQAAGVFVIAGHFNGGNGAAAAQFAGRAFDDLGDAGGLFVLGAG
jgi:hypothetical protein